MSRQVQQPDADFIALQQALAGEYSLDREIGRGGMGVVYLAREVRLARQVAIKVLPPALGERIRSRGPLLPGEAARLLREVAWALAYAHGKGIVHRDITAENIVLERGTDRAIVMDFGIASAMRSSALSDDGRVMGNAHYVSPEQAVGEPLDGRSDLYSLGACGYYALTGRLPFDAATPEEIVTQHLTVPAPPVARFAHTTPSRLAQAVDRCLAKDPDGRFRTAETFAEAIDLAYEHAKEIPIALRVWIQQGESESAPRAMLILWGGVLGSLIAVVNMSPWLFPLTLFGAAAVSFFPVLTRLRRVLEDGYVVDDLHAALREHDLLRSEELQYERRFSLAGLSPALRVMLVASVSSMGALSWLVRHSLSFVGRNVPAADANFFRAAFTFAALFAIGSTVGLAGSRG
ncbi:MAG: serine/threonine-protein kinase [Gemmatimonadaceae bacterium]